ncbi:MAG: hypothetical protein ACETWM_07900 [Candidatus Lokiarchaeia archaeon]
MTMNKMIQMMKAGKNSSLSFFLWAVTFDYVSCDGLRVFHKLRAHVTRVTVVLWFGYYSETLLR